MALAAALGRREGVTRNMLRMASAYVQHSCTKPRTRLRDSTKPLWGQGIKALGGIMLPILGRCGSLFHESHLAKYRRERLIADGAQFFSG